MTQQNFYSVNPSNYVFQSFLRPWTPYVNVRPMMLETYPSLPYFNIFIQPFRAQPNNFNPSNYYLQSLPCAPIQQKQIPLISPNKAPPVAISLGQYTPETQKIIEISDDDLPPPQKSKNSTQELSPQKCMSAAGSLRAKVECKKAIRISNRLVQIYRNSRKKKCPTEVKTRSIGKSQKKMKISRCAMMKSDKKMRRLAKLRDQKPRILIGPQFQAVLPKCMLHSEALLDWKQSRRDDLLSRRIQ